MDIEEKIKELKVNKCLKCGRETHRDDNDELFCTGCGTPVINRCSNYECYEVLDELSAYCKYCGNKSTFLNLTLIKSTINNPDDSSYVELDNIEDLPF